MSVNFEDLDPDSPEYEAAVAAAQDAEDQARGNPEPEPEEEGEATEAAPADEAETAAVVEQEDTPKVAGVASKDGSRVLPYAALKAERRNARQASNRAEKAEREAQALRQQLEDIRAGKQPAKDESEISDDDLAELEADFPQVAKVAKAARDAKRELEALKAQNKPPLEDDPDTDEDPVQDAIDSVPLLSEWQASDQEKFTRAVEIDKALENSPKWKGKPLSARFAHVAGLVADEFDLEVHEDPKPQEKPTPAKADPKEVIKGAKRAPPNTLSDLKSGAADPTDERIERMSPHRMLARFASMTDAEIDAHLAKAG